MVAVPGDIVVAPFPAIVIRFGYAYAGSGLRLIELDGGADFFGWHSRLLYVSPTLNVGMKVDAGDPIGVAQDVAAYYRQEHPGHVGDITGHVHWEVTMPVDGGGLLPAGLQVVTA